ncbi:hypothetical protein OSTOST_07644 [Ostertagia ostertagi]
MVECWPLCVLNAVLAYFSAAYLINLCSKRKDKQQQSSGSRDSKQPYVPPPQAPKPPAVQGVAGTYDPNYQTLANIQGDVFGADKKAAPAPAIKAGGPGMAVEKSV